MFSSRLGGTGVLNQLTRAVERKRQTGAHILDLTESNPTHAGIAYEASAITQLLADSRALRYDPEPAGLPAAREAVSGYYADRGLGVTADRILLTASTSEAYSYLFKLLCDPGDEVLVPRPSYPLFEFLAGLESVRVVRYPLAWHGRWEMDFEALAAACTARTRAVVVVNPNNPTGSFLRRDEGERLAAFCGARELAIISDEVFSDYALSADPRRLASLTGAGGALTFCMSGLSKIVGLPQMKLGWMVVGGSENLRAEAWRRLEFIADTYLSVGAPVQHALPGLLAARHAIQKRIAARVRGNLDFLVQQIDPDSPFALRRPEGGWYAVVEAPRIRTEEEWVLRLLEDGDVLVQPGFFYDFDREAFLVLSLLTGAEAFREGVQRIFGSLIVNPET
jgi:alanine-synthesizing transaminase